MRVPPDLWNVEEAPEGVVVNWFYEEGAEVPAGAALVEVAVEKVPYEIEAPAAGRLHVEAPVDTPVRPGDLLGTIEAGDA
ncbi:MAG: lipoyl domain-containing protein [Bacillota bacterium]|nr:lipoyl domain-containing protein [Bacillota bacterium]